WRVVSSHNPSSPFLRIQQHTTLLANQWSQVLLEWDDHLSREDKEPDRHASHDQVVSIWCGPCNNTSSYVDNTWTQKPLHNMDMHDDPKFEGQKCEHNLIKDVMVRNQQLDVSISNEQMNKIANITYSHPCIYLTWIVVHGPHAYAMQSE
ncbi:hypothetical protein, partial [Rothia koreensis]|uniref:hypothetical protein n=1 Tax=Rothia koreensis TaxID=592378 RepID=UPI001F0CF7A3